MIVVVLNHDQRIVETSEQDGNYLKAQTLLY